MTNKHELRCALVNIYHAESFHPNLISVHSSRSFTLYGLHLTTIRSGLRTALLT